MIVDLDFQSQTRSIDAHQRKVLDTSITRGSTGIKEIGKELTEIRVYYDLEL